MISRPVDIVDNEVYDVHVLVYSIHMLVYIVHVLDACTLCVLIAREHKQQQILIL